MKKLVVLLVLIVFAIGCAHKPVNMARIKIKGSDTMLQLTKALAEEYMKTNPGISIYVEGGGTASGIKSIINGNVDICTASRTLNPNEISTLAEKFSTIGISYLVARDGLSVYLNSNNSIKNLTTSQLKDIFTGKISNWKDVGGENAPIRKIIRTTNSGTYFYFREHILQGSEYDPNSIVKYNTQSVIDYVSQDKFSIGYGGIGYNEGIKLVNINGISPTEENVRKNEYPICRYLYFYTATQSGSEIQRFINWALSMKGQQIVRETGYIPIWRITY